MTRAVEQHPVDLEPSLVGANTYVSRRRLGRLDAATVLVIMIGLLLLIPARYIIPELTDLGRPAIVIGLLLFFWWIMVRLSPRLVLVGPQPLRFAVLAYIASLLASYGVGYLRGLTTMEANSADRAILFMLSFVGIILMTADGLANWERLNLVLRAFVYCSAFVALIGLIQTLTASDITEYMVVPGLEAKGWVPIFEERGAGLRVASTTSHYIEFSTIMAIALPFAIHFARYATTRGRRQLFIGSAILIAAAIPATVSRTGLIALALVLVCTVPLWPWRMRFNLAVLSVLLISLFLVVKPKLVDTFVNLFATATADPSITSRTGRYDLVYYYFSQRPWLGRGTGTWVSPQYQYLDNQWLSQVLSTGVVGVAALLGLHITAIVLAALALRRATNPADKHLCGALIGAQLVAIAVGLTFDSLSFSSYMVVLALMIGCTGTVWRFTHPARTVRTSSTLGRPEA